MYRIIELQEVAMKKTKSIISIFLVFALMLCFVPGVVWNYFSVSASASSNEESVYDFMTQTLGVNSAVACGVLANIAAESSFSPTASCIDTNGLTSYGICQWNGGRFTNLKNYCSNHGYSYNTITGQLNFLKYELQNSESYAWSKIKNQENTQEGAYYAGYNWAKYFERCASSYYEGRAISAKNTYWPKYNRVIPDNFTTDSRYPTPIIAYPVASSGTITLYRSDLSAYPANERNISFSDQCTINKIYTNGYCSVTYPTASGQNTELAKTSDFIVGNVTPYSWSPEQNATSYMRSDLSSPIGTVYSSDVCTVVGKDGAKMQLIDPLDVGGYKLGWIDSAYVPPTTEPERPSVIIPDPVASGILNDKRIVAVAPHQITFASTAYISEGDICILYNINQSTGYCSVDYPSNSNDVFTASSVRTNTVAINEFINYNGSAKSETVTIPNQLTVYPTQAMTSSVGSYSSNWWLDPGDVFTTINKINNATEILYYCNQGKHAGYWKLGWVGLSYYSLDINGFLDNSSSNSINYYGTVDIYINGIKRADDVSDFNSSNGEYPFGSTFEIKDIKPYQGYTYHGVHSGETTGTLNSNKLISLDFRKNESQCISIIVSQAPNKQVYSEGEALNTDGLIVLGIYEDGSSKNITNYCDITGFDSSPGIKVLQVNYNDLSTAFSVIVEEKIPIELTIESQPSKTKYYPGEHFESQGLSVIVTFNNNTSDYVFDYHYSDNPLTLEDYCIDIFYTYNGTTLTKEIPIEVIEDELDYFEIFSMPDKTNYYIGETLDLEGLSIIAYYKTGETKLINQGLICSPQVLSNVGYQDVTVFYGGKAASFSVFVSEREVNSEDSKIIVSSVTGVIGETVDVDILLENNPGIIALKINIGYDPSVLSLISLKNGELMGESIFDYSNDINQVPFTVMWNDINENHTNNGTLVTLKFKISENAGTTSVPITLTYDSSSTFNTDLDNVSFYTINGIVEINECNPGDADSDGEITLKDVVIMRRYLSGGWNIDLNQKNSDVDNDSEITLKDVVIIRRYLSGGWNIDLSTYRKTENDELIISSSVYGQSENGRDLICYSFTPPNYSKTILLNFAIHGFEDNYAGDGQVLVDAANELINYYDAADKLHGCRLVIVPCANPDGLLDGYSNNDFGRCNAKGIDLNRDFDANYVANTTKGRYYSPYAFSAAESRALRDLYNNYQPDIVCDFHGWLNYTIGDAEIAEVFSEEMNLSHYVSFTSSNAGGYFANWAHQQGSLALLVEFSNPNISIENLKTSVNRLILGDYGNSQDKYDLDPKYSIFTNGISAYTISSGRVTTYKGVNEPFDTPSYIDGASDLCTINCIYENGWVKVSYPTTSGTKTAYCKLSDFIESGTAVTPYSSNVATNSTVYRRSDYSETMGSVWSTDEFYVVAQVGNKKQIIYPLDDGGWKMGWIII